MLNKKFYYLLLINSLLLLGLPVMSADFLFNKAVMDKFKKEINYAALLAKPHVPTYVVMDWKKKLSGLKDAQGRVWSVTFSDPYIDAFGQGVLDVYFKTGDMQINMVVTSLSENNWSGRLDYAVRQLTFTNRGDVNAMVKPGLGDIYFVPKHSAGTTFCSFILANFYIELDAVQEENVELISHPLLEIMQQYQQPTVVLGPKKTSWSIDKKNPRSERSLLLLIRERLQIGPKIGWYRFQIVYCHPVWLQREVIKISLHLLLQKKITLLLMWLG